MKKYNCNNTLDYAHEASRMCETFDCCDDCPCPLYGMSCGHLEITAEHIKRVQEWSDAHPEVVLTDKQREILEALKSLGFRYVAKDNDRSVYAFTKRPKKRFEAWGRGGKYLNVKNFSEDVYATVFPLVEWNDTEPLCIAEALEQAEEANP